jgi:hypothetical protein
MLQLDNHLSKYRYCPSPVFAWLIKAAMVLGEVYRPLVKLCLGIVLVHSKLCCKTNIIDGAKMNPQSRGHQRNFRVSRQTAAICPSVIMLNVATSVILALSIYSTITPFSVHGLAYIQIPNSPPFCMYWGEHTLQPYHLIQLDCYTIPSVHIQWYLCR